MLLREVNLTDKQNQKLSSSVVGDTLHKLPGSLIFSITWSLGQHAGLTPPWSGDSVSSLLRVCGVCTSEWTSSFFP